MPKAEGEPQKPNPVLVQLGVVGVCVAVLWAIYQFSWVPFRENHDRKTSDREDLAGASLAAPQPPAANESGQAHLKAFIAWVNGKFKDGTLTIDAKGSSCEKNGLCEKWEGEENEFTVYFFRKNPSAVRLTANIPMEMTCELLGGTALRTWDPRPTGLIRAGGAICKPCASVGGLGAVIENNRLANGAFSAGVHLVTGPYVEADSDFMRGVTSDVNGRYQ